MKGPVEVVPNVVSNAPETSLGEESLRGHWGTNWDFTGPCGKGSRTYQRRSGLHKKQVLLSYSHHYH